MYFFTFFVRNTDALLPGFLPGFMTSEEIILYQR